MEERFFRAIPTADVSPIEDFEFSYRIPSFRCPNCSASYLVSHLSYPNLDPRDVLSEDELQLIDYGSRSSLNDNMAVLTCAKKLEQHFKVPVSAGAYFGALSLKILSRPKLDIEISLLQDLYIRRSMAHRLVEAGLKINFSNVSVNGKRAAGFDFVQLLAPIVAVGVLPDEVSFCSVCYRRSPNKVKVPCSLFDDPNLRKHLICKTINTDQLIISGTFVTASRQLGIKGFQEGKTILPVSVAKRG